MSHGKGPSNFNRPHRFTFVFNQNLPNKFTSCVGKTVLNDWAINGFLVAQSGNPRTVTNRDSGAGIGGSAYQVNASNLMSDVTADAQLVSSGSVKDNLDHYINPGAFTKAKRGTFGNSGRGMFDGPGQFNVDFSVFKNIPITERVRLQFRTEFFNIFNHANFSNPSANMDSSNFGVIRDTSVNARLVQLALKLTF